MISLGSLKESVDRHHVFAHADDGDRAILFDLMEELRTAREALAAEKLDHLATMKRWLRIAEKQARAIAKARKLMRGPSGAKGPTIRTVRAEAQKQFADVYAALGWRARR